jgi:hypothetical protein
VFTSGTYPWSFVTQIFHSGQPSHGGDRKMFEVMTSTLPKVTLLKIPPLLVKVQCKKFSHTYINQTQMYLKYNVQELLTLPEHLSSSPFLNEVLIVQSLVLFCQPLIVLFLLVTALFILFRITTSVYPCGMFILFSHSV